MRLTTTRRDATDVTIKINKEGGISDETECVVDGIELLLSA